MVQCFICGQKLRSVSNDNHPDARAININALFICESSTLNVDKHKLQIFYQKISSLLSAKWANI